MSFAADQAISAELAPGERLLWSGQPARGIRLRRGDIFLLLFGLGWIGFTIYAMAFPTRSGESLFSPFGVLFLLVGLYLLVGRFLVDARLRGQTAYGLTNQRAIIVTRPLFGDREVKSLPLRALSEVTLAERPDGSGTIRLGPAVGNRNPSFLTDAAWPGLPRPPMFEMIPNAREVYTMIRMVQHSEPEF